MPLLLVPVMEPFEFSVPVNVVFVFQVSVTVLPLMEPLTPPHVFSPNSKEQFLDYLRSIREGISTEHAEAIREVYGDDRLAGIPRAQDKG